MNDSWAIDLAAGTPDPLGVVTDLDVAALVTRGGVLRGTGPEGARRANERFLEITGLVPAAALGWDWLLVVDPPDRDRLRRGIEAATRSGARSEFTVRARRTDGHPLALRVRIGGVHVPGGRGFVATFELRPVAELRDGQDRGDAYRILLEALPAAVAYVAPQGSLDFVNAAWIAATGLVPAPDPDHAAIRDDLGPSVLDALRRGVGWRGRAPIGSVEHAVTVVPIAPRDGGGALVVLGLDDGPDPERRDERFERVLASYASLIDAMPDHAAIVQEGRLLHVNATARRAMGIGADEPVADLDLATVITFSADPSPPDGGVPLERLREEGTVLTDGELVLGTGPALPVTVLLFSITDLDGEHAATLCIARDRTDAVVAHTRQAALDAIVRSAPAAIFVVDASGAVTVWNPGCQTLFGWTVEEVIGAPPPFIELPLDTPGLGARERLEAGEIVRGRPSFRRRDGGRVCVDLASAPILGRDGALSAIVTVAVDITRQIAAGNELEYRADVDRLTAAIARLLVDATAATIDQRVGEALRLVAERSGASAACLVRRDDPCRFCWPGPGERQRLTADGCGAFVAATLHDRTYEAGWVVAGGAGPVGALVLQWPDDPGVGPDDLAALEMLATALVATVDRVDAEVLVSERDLRFRTLAEHSKDLIVVLDAEMSLLYVSPAATAVLGLTEATRWDPGRSIIHDDDRDALVARMMTLVLEPEGWTTETFTTRLKTADGTYAPFELSATNLIANPAIGGVVISGRDVRSRQAMEAKLRESERRFRALVANLAESVTVLDAEGRVKYSSPSASRMLGFDTGHGDGSGALDFVLEEDREPVGEILGRAFAEPGVHGPITVRVRTADGGVRYLEALGHNRLDDPDVEGVIVTARDITERIEAEEAVQRSDARFSALVENLSDVVTVVAPGGEIVYTSPTARRLFGFEAGDDSQTDPISRMHPDDRDEAVAALGEHVAGTHPDPVRFRLRAADDTWHVVEVVARDLTDEPSVGGLVVTTRDVSDRARAESLVADQARVLTLIARGAPLSETLRSVCEVLEEQVPGSVFGILLLDPATGMARLGAGPRIPAALASTVERAVIDPNEPSLRRAGVIPTEAPPQATGDWRNGPVCAAAAQDGFEALWSSPILESTSERVLGIVLGGVSSAHRVTPYTSDVVEMFARTAGIAIERKLSEDLLAHRANHDSLTGLPNRVLFLEFLSHALARARRGRHATAVLFLDLDRFKHVNDGLGHDAGDLLLRQLSERLRAAMRPSDVVARFGGDEFTVLCDGLDPERPVEQLHEIARRLLDVIERPLTIDGEDRRLSASIGIALATPESTPDGLLSDADAAMYEAKQHGKARWEIFDDVMRAEMNARLDLESRLERAIERDEFRLYLQPILDLPTGRCVGAEALLRWRHPELGIITPDQFIGLAEETGLIIPMGEWALRDACRTVAEWDAAGLLDAEFTVAVNLSARQVAQADLVARVRNIIERSGAVPSRICLEITESVLMEESSVETVQELKALGVSISIDDFGTGYSSLGYLKRFPVDAVKVDRSFVDGLGTDGEDSAIVTAVVSLGHALGLAVVAEGVETSCQLRELLALGCERAQGYWFSGPRDAVEFAALLHAQPWLTERPLGVEGGQAVAS